MPVVPPLPFTTRSHPIAAVTRFAGSRKPFSRSSLPLVSRLVTALLLAGGIAASLPARAQAPGTILTVAGTGEAGAGGEGGPAASTPLHSPEGVALGPDGSLFFSDSLNHRVRRVTPGGLLVTVAGTGVAGYGGDDGPATQALLDRPEGIAVDALGHLFIADYGNHRVRRVTPGGRITTLAGELKGDAGDGLPARAAALRAPIGVTVDPKGQIYIADPENFRVRKVGPDGILTAVAGNGIQGSSGDGGPAINAQLNYPTDVAVDAAGNVYIADAVSNVVRKVDPQGTITPYAGTGVAGYGGDGGPATQALLDTPTDLAVDSAGNLYIADSFNHVIRKVSPEGVITTVAGSGNSGAPGEGIPATTAQLNVPIGVEVDREGHLYIADSESHRIRKVFGVAAPGLVPGAYLPASGDVNRDNAVNVLDAIRVLQSVVGQGTLTPEEVRIADLNGDGAANVGDAVLILRDAVGL
ncbi:MAG: hypothetical protein KY468_10685 [Armatimonadetes bacterium]|nr:hypothetical protein [Armatimonadota bacterium]